MYKAMCECQALHPDEEQSISDGMDIFGSKTFAYLPTLPHSFYRISIDSHQMDVSKKFLIQGTMVPVHQGQRESDLDRSRTD